MPYTIQGQPADISTEPVLKGDKHYIPLREVVEALGGTLSWDNATKTADAVIGPWDASITDGSVNVTVTGNNQTRISTVTRSMSRGISLKMSMAIRSRSTTAI
jgi:hypothetical protein